MDPRLSSSPSDSYLLQWKSFSTAFLSHLADFRGDDALADVTLFAGPQRTRFSAHRLVLSAGSPYFRDVFRHLPREQHPVILLKDVLPVDLEAALQFIYLGQVHVAQERLAAFLKVAEGLEIRGLSEEKASPPQGNSKKDLKRLRPQQREVSSANETCQEEKEERRKMRKRDSVSIGKGAATHVIKTEEEAEEGDEQQHLVIPADPNLTHFADPAEDVENDGPQGELVVLFSENGRCHFCRVLCPDRQSLLVHLETEHQPPRHALCENCENFFHVCAIHRHRSKCAERYRSQETR